MTTPAEKLAAAKPPRKCASPATARNRRAYPWVCRVRERRQALRLSLRDVATGAGLSIAGLCAIELGSDPQLSTANRLAKFFGVAVEILWPKRKRKVKG